MILLDTNVISEPLKLSADAGVLSWIDAQSIDTLYLSAISLAELRFGIAALPTGKRKETLHLGLEQRILPFDASASQAYAEILTTARAQGRAISTADGYIAATAKRHGLMVATRDASPFEAAGLTVINPWTVQH